MTSPSSSSSASSARPATAGPDSGSTAGSAGSSSTGATSGKSADVLDSPQGTTTVAQVVVQKIAGLAARELSGVHNLGGGSARAFGALRERIPGASASSSQGVSVEVGERQAAVDLDLVVEYGVAIADLANAIRKNVITAIERMTGLEVMEVNITVNDLHLPTDDEEDGESTPGRVR